jgi:membrane carboxypeptidase/penicillin-binding protein PbpC
MDERVAWLISDILSDDQARYLGFGRNSILQLDRPAAVKTGTTTNFHDNWTVGYTPSLVVGVWAGNTNHEGMRDITGLTGAAPIWAQTMRSILTGTNEEEFTRPADMIQLPVCKLSGLLPGDACTQQKMEWFIPGTQPTTVDTFHQVVLLDSRDGLLADDSTPAEERYPGVALNLPDAAQRWAREQGLLLLADVVRDPLADKPAEANGQGLKITSPANGSIYHLAEGVPLASQQIQIQMTGAAGLQQVNYYLDDSLLATVNAAPFTFWWQLSKGSHVLKAVVLLDGGDSLSSEPVMFTVK